MKTKYEAARSLIEQLSRRYYGSDFVELQSYDHVKVHNGQGDLGWQVVVKSSTGKNVTYCLGTTRAALTYFREMFNYQEDTPHA